MISKEISDQLGLGKEEPKPKGKQRANGGKSILKKSSVLGSKELLGSRESLPEKAERAEREEGAKKAKKSVMFTKSRFAE